MPLSNLYDIRLIVARLLFHAMLLLCFLFLVRFFLCPFFFCSFVAILARRRNHYYLFLFYNSNLISSNLSIRQRRELKCVCELNHSHVFFSCILRSVFLENQRQWYALLSKSRKSHLILLHYLVLVSIQKEK